MFDSRIYTFLTLYEEMNYSRTAERLNMTQPGVSQHIRKLEEHYGVKLFSYEGRELRATREGDVLKRHLDSMLVEERAIMEEFSRSEAVHLRVGATKTIGEFVLVPAVKKFLSDSSHSLDFTIDNTAALLKMLEDGKLDFAVIEGVIDKSRYGWRLFKKEKFVGICGKNHRFAGAGCGGGAGAGGCAGTGEGACAGAAGAGGSNGAKGPVPIEEIFKETLLVREKGSGTRNILERELTDKGFGLHMFRRVTSLGNFSVIMEILEGGSAITFAYKTIAEQRDDLATFQVEGMDLEGEFNFVFCNEKIAS